METSTKMPIAMSPVVQVAVVGEKQAAQDLDLDRLRRPGRQLSEEGWGKSVEGRWFCAQGMPEGF